MKLGELHEDFNIELAKIKVPPTAMQWINNTQQPIKEGYVMYIMDDAKCVVMSSEDPGKRTKDKQLVQVFPVGGAVELNQWEIVSLIEE